MLKEAPRPSEIGEILPHNSSKTVQTQEQTEKQAKQGPDDGAREIELEKILFPTENQVAKKEEK
jgi:hypothetical protein